MNGKTLKSRYLSLKQDGAEMYIEDVADGQDRGLCPACPQKAGGGPQSPAQSQMEHHH